MARHITPTTPELLAAFKRGREGGDVFKDELEEIEGVVSLDSQGGYVMREDHSVGSFSFAAWRRIGEPITRRKLIVLRPLPVSSGLEWSKDFPALTSHRVQVMLSPDQSRSIFVRAIRSDIDSPEFLAIAEKLQEPVVISTAIFGDLELDAEWGWFEGEAQWNGQTVDVRFHPDDEQSIEGSLATAESLWSDQERWIREVGEYMVEELLDVKNRGWLKDGEEPQSPEAFKSAITLESISFHPNGFFRFWHDDGDLFLCHNIEVGGTLREGIKWANLQG